MKISNNYNMPNFKGYKNLITFDQESKGNRLALFAVQLDNNGTKDLENYKQLTKFDKCFDSKMDDTLLCIYSENPNHRAMYLNNDILLSGNELKEASKKLSKKQFPQIESGYLKAYTQLASLTKRIMTDNNSTIKDEGMQKVMQNAQKILTSFCDGNSSIAFQILRNAFYNVCPQKSTSIINSGISKLLKNYF